MRHYIVSFIHKSLLLSIFLNCVSFADLLSKQNTILAVHNQSQQSNKPMRVLFVVGNFPTLSETFVLNQITGLIDRGHEVFIYTPAKAAKGSEDKVHQEIENYHLLERTYYAELPPDLNDFDIIYCQFGPLGKLFLEIKEQYNFSAKLVTCLRGYDLSRYVWYEGERTYDELFKAGDLFLPVCDYFKEKLIKLGCEPEKIIVHHSAIDCSKFTFKPRLLDSKKQTIRIVSVNRVIEKKGTLFAMLAVARLLKKYPNIKYTIIGDGYLYKELAALAKELQIEGKVKLIGSATHDQVIKILDKAHIFILPCKIGLDHNEEGIPNALKEAMAMGIPVLSTYHSGIVELVDDKKSGFLVPENDINILAEKLEYLVNHPEVWGPMGLAGRKKVEDEFDLEKINDRLVEIFRNLLDSSETRGPVGYKPPKITLPYDLNFTGPQSELFQE